MKPDQSIQYILHQYWIMMECLRVMETNQMVQNRALLPGIFQDDHEGRLNKGHLGNTDQLLHKPGQIPITVDSPTSGTSVPYYKIQQIYFHFNSCNYRAFVNK